MHNYKLVVSYDGTNYSGWQIQPNGCSIQELLEKAVSTSLGGPHVSVVGSGRTDAGVHAFRQVAHFHTEKSVEIRRLHYSLNGLLPPDIRVQSVEEVPLSFHSQRSALGKEYHYFLHTQAVANPFHRLYSWHVRRALCPHLLQESASLFCGTHDFTSFTNEAHAGAASRNPIRTLYRLQPCPTEQGWRLEFFGNGFLYKMVRNIVGCIVEVASQQRPLSDISRILAAKDRRQAGMAAPAHGLFLAKVEYTHSCFWNGRAGLENTVG